jgi:hypothetical protein
MKKEKKFYTFTIEEHNGGQEYSWKMGCWANTEVGAIRKARAYTKKWYDNYDGKPREVEENVFSFDGVGIYVTMDWFGESNFEKFKKELVDRAMLT